MSRFYQVRKIIIGCLVFAILWIQLSTNASFNVPPLPGPQTDLESIALNNLPFWRRADSFLKTIGHYLGLTTYWRMFAPPNKVNWYYKMIGTLKNGEQVLLLNRENVAHKTFIDRNFIDFREAKFEHNTVRSPAWQYAYLQHICRRAKPLFPSLETVMLLHSWRAMLPPDQAAPGRRFYEKKGLKVISNVPCL